MSTGKSPLRDRLLSNSPDPIKSSIIRESGMGWISPTSNPGSQSSASSGSITSPLRIAKRDSPRILPQPPIARRSSSSYRHVRNNNLVSKSPFKSQIPTPSSTPSRNIPITFPSPRRVSGEKRPRPSSMHQQAEDENERPFSFKRERRQSKGFQGLIQKEPVTKSPFRQRTPSAEDQSAPTPQPPLPLSHLLPKLPTPSNTPAQPITSLAPSESALPTTGISPGRSSLVSRRMHGPRLSSGSRSTRQRRKTVTWDERCDVLEFSREEDETEEEVFNSGAEEDEKDMQVEYESQPEEDPFFRGHQEREVGSPSAQEGDSSDESIHLADTSGDPDPSLIGMTLDPDASISGLVDEIFATSSVGNFADIPDANILSDTVASSTPPRHSHLPPDVDTEDGVPLGRSHHATRLIQRSQSPRRTPQPAPHFSPYQSVHSSPQQLSAAYAFNLPTHASPHGPPATPPRRPAVSSPKINIQDNLDAEKPGASSLVSIDLPSPAEPSLVGPAHLATPPLGRSTHAERHQKAREGECDDVLMLPGTPSPCKSTRKPDSTKSNRVEGLIPHFGIDIVASNILTSSPEDPFSLSRENEVPSPQTWEESQTAESIAEDTLNDHSELEDESMTGVECTSRSVDDSFHTEMEPGWEGDGPSRTSEGLSCFEDMSHSSLPYAASSRAHSSSPQHGSNRSQDLESFTNDSRPSTPPIITQPSDQSTSQAVEGPRVEKDRMSVLTNMTDFSTETAVIERAEKKTLTAANIAQLKELGLLDSGERLQFDFGSKFGRGLDISGLDYSSRKPSLDSFGVIAVSNKEKTPSIQSGGSSSMKMGDVDVDMDMRSALDRLMDDVAGAQVDESDTDEGGSFEILRPVTNSSNPRVMERASTDSALLHNGFLSRNVSVASDSSSIPPPVPPKDNIRSREQMILEKRREARRLEVGGGEEENSLVSSNLGVQKEGQDTLGVGRPSRRRSMSTGDAEVLGGGAKRRGDIMLDVEPAQGDKLGDSIEKELKKLVEAPSKSKTKYLVREHQGTIYASSSDPDSVSHLAGPGDVNAGKAWRTVRRPSDMNEYSKQLKEYRAHEKNSKAYGKVFVKVLGVKGIHVPLPQQATALTCTLNNGIHFVSTPECQLGRDFRVEQEFELIEHSKLEFTLTLKIRRDPHIIAQFKALTPPAPQAPVAPPIVQSSSKGGMRSFFSSSPKKSKDKFPIQVAPTIPSAQRLPENLARYLKPDGTLARAFISFKDIASRCDTRLFETSYPLIGQRVELGGKFSTLQIGEIVLQMFRLPPLPGIPPEQLPQSLEECHRGLRHINWHKITYFEGILTQSGGDCSTWRRRQLRVIGANLVAFNDVTKKATATIDLKKAVSVEDDQEARKNALSPGIRTGRYDEYDELYGVERSFRLIFPQGQEILFFADTDEEKARWLEVLRALIGHIPPHPFWAELLWQRQEELTRAAQSSARASAHPSPSWVV
ncbi:hypothetical protein H0H81_004266 [Sphagnurus paluster]|uniref:PH domain-containing protein n=1 Tax=Sphagnurus paluster TaxID=117069 RepID=A0A9P7K644_9AGAR|nr:hypothetical protein H0H81_004266 [Sphagnurus paluster]